MKPAAAPAAPAGSAARPENRPLFKVALLLVAVGVVGVLAAGLFFGYRALAGGDQAEVADNVAPAPKHSATPPDTVPPPVASGGAEPRTSIGKRVRQTTDAAAARVAEIPLDEPAEPASAPPAAAPSVAAQPAPVPPPTAVPPAKTAEPRALEPSAAFQLWVSEARVSGVRRAAEARAFINGRLFRQGDTVDHQLGIVFAGLDPNQNVLLFRDASGSVIGKKF